MKSGLLFVILCPVAGAVLGLSLFSPAGILIPVLFSFMMLKIGSKPFQIFVTALTYLLTAVFASLAAKGMFIRLEDAMAVGAGLVTLYLLSAIGYTLGARKGRTYWRGVLGGAAGFGAGCLAIFLTLFFFHGQDIAHSLVSAFTHRVESDVVEATARLTVGMDTMLNFEGTSAEMQQAVQEVMTRDAATVLRQFVNVMEPVVRKTVGGFAICASLLVGLLSSVGVGIMNRIRGFAALEHTPLQGRTVPVQLVPLRDLMFPKKLTISVILAWVCALIMVAAEVPGAEVMYPTVSMVAGVVFTISGICLIDFFLNISRLHWAVRLIIIIVVLTVCSGTWLLKILGLIDAVLSPRKKIFVLKGPFDRMNQQ